MSLKSLREHAKRLHVHLGPSRIGRPLPYSYDELVDFILHVQRVHLAPLRGYGGSLARAELAAEAAAVDYVMHGGERLPLFGDLAVLRTLDPAKLRNHAVNLYTKLGPLKITMPVPLNYEDLLDWVLTVERTHLAPLRGLRSFEKAELKAERDLVRAELGYPYYGGSLARKELKELNAERNLVQAELEYPYQ